MNMTRKNTMQLLLPSRPERSAASSLGLVCLLGAGRACLTDFDFDPSLSRLHVILLIHLILTFKNNIFSYFQLSFILIMWRQISFIEKEMLYPFNFSEVRKILQHKHIYIYKIYIKQEASKMRVWEVPVTMGLSGRRLGGSPRDHVMLSYTLSASGDVEEWGYLVYRRWSKEERE